MSAIYYTDGTLVRGGDGKAYVFVQGQLRIVTGPLVVDKEGRDVGGSVLERLPLLPSEQLEAFPIGEARQLEAAILGEQPEKWPENGSWFEVRSDMPRRYMRTQATLWQEERRIGCYTETMTRQPWFGFVGGVMVLLADGNGSFLWNSDLKQFGVDGFRIGKSMRGEEWYQDVPAEIAQKASQVRVVHTHAPRANIYQQLEKTLQVTMDIIAIVAQLAALVG